MEKKFIYPSTQLIALLHPKVLKVFLYLLGWQHSKSVKVYPKTVAKFTKLSEKEVEISIQTLIDNKLIQVVNNDGFEVIFNREDMYEYFGIPIEEVPEMELLPVSTEITWNKATNITSIEDMTEEQIKSLILKLEVSLKEKEEVKKLIKNSTEKDDLPF